MVHNAGFVKQQFRVCGKDKGKYNLMPYGFRQKREKKTTKSSNKAGVINLYNGAKVP